MLAIHPKARTTPAVRAEIARSTESSGVLAQRYGVSTETVRKWRKRGPVDCQDRSSRPHKLPWKATEEERAIVCALRRATGFPLDDLTFVVTHFLPHLNRDAVCRILKAEGLGRLSPASRSRKPDGTFKTYDLGFVHVDVKHLPKLRPLYHGLVPLETKTPSQSCSRSLPPSNQIATVVLERFRVRRTHILNWQCSSDIRRAQSRRAGCRWSPREQSEFLQPPS